MISTSYWVLRFILGDLGDTHLLVCQWSGWRRYYLWNNIFSMSGIVFPHRKGLDFNVRHGLYIEKGHGLLVRALSLYKERAWFIKSSIVPSHPSIFHSCLFIHCLGSHQDVLVSHCQCSSSNYS